jgi:DNA-binding response OmpR family regulator
VKPVSPREVVARVRAILRRGEVRDRPSTVIAVSPTLELDLGRREVTSYGCPVPLAGRELDVLAFLAQNRGIALSRRQLLDGVWGPAWEGDERTVDVHVAQLRKKLGDALPLTTVWGVGYRLDG